MRNEKGELELVEEVEGRDEDEKQEVKERRRGKQEMKIRDGIEGKS